MSYARPPLLEDACARLPVLLTLDGVPVRWLGPLVNGRQCAAVSEMSNAAWGHLASCGWEAELEGAGELFDAEGEVRPAFARAFAEAARALADEGAMAGPESSVELWAAWLGFELAATHGTLKALAHR